MRILKDILFRMITLDEGRGNFVWEDGKYLYMITGDLTKEELIRMAETIK